MVWYIPPLSPIVDSVASTGYDAEDVDNLFGAIDVLRIPMEYLANLFTAGNVTPVRAALEKMAAMRSYMRDINLGGAGNEEIAAKVGMDPARRSRTCSGCSRCAKYDERYVIPPSHKEQAHSLESISTECPVGEGGTAPRQRSRGRDDRQLLGREGPAGDRPGTGHLPRLGRSRHTDLGGEVMRRWLPGIGRRAPKVPARELPDDQLRVTWQAVSLLLDYPSVKLSTDAAS